MPDIRIDDIIEARKINDAFIELEKNIAGTVTELKQLITVGGQVKQMFDNEKQSVSGVTSAMMENEKLAQQRQKTEREAIKLAKDKITLEEKLTRQAEKEAKAEREANSVYQQKSKRLQELRNAAKDAGAQFGTMSKEFKKASDAANKLDKELKDIDGKLGQFNRNVGNYSSAFDGFKKGAAIFGAVGVAITGMATGMINMLSTFGKFEKYKSVLKNTFGSTAEATDAMNMLADTAAKLPIALDELTQGYIKLVNRGFKPTQAELIKLSDVANSQGKSLDMFIEAMLDAQTGEFERLKEFGIKAKKNGDMIAFSFKGQTTEVKNTEQAIQEYILSLGDMAGVAGSSAAVMNTFEGNLSNLGDSWDALMVAMGEGGFGEIAKKMISGISGIVQGFTEMVKKSPVESLKEEQAELNVLVNSITTANINQKTRNELIGELQTKYPDFLKNLDIEKVTNEELTKQLALANDEYLKKIKLAVIQEDLQANEKALIELQKQERQYIKDVNLKYEQLVKNKQEGLTLDEKLAEIAKIKYQNDLDESGFQYSYNAWAATTKKKLKNIDSERNDLEKQYTDLLKERGKVDNEIKTKSAGITIEQTTATNELTKSEKERLKNLKEHYKSLTRQDEEQLKRLKQVQKGSPLEKKKDIVNVTDIRAGLNEKDLKGVSPEELAMRRQMTLKQLEAYEFANAEERKQMALDETLKRNNELNTTLQMYSDWASARRAKEEQEIDERTRKQLANENLTESERQRIQENAEKQKEAARKKEAAIQRKIAIIEKAQALFSIFMSTKESIASSMKVGAPWGFVLAAAAAAFGAAQAAMVASKPIPAYAKGRKGGNAEMARVGENGPEMGIKPDGTTRLFKNEQITFLSKGEKVLTAKETANVLSMRARGKAMIYSDSVSNNNAELMELRGLRKDVRNNKSNIQIHASSNIDILAIQKRNDYMKTYIG